MRFSFSFSFLGGGGGWSYSPSFPIEMHATGANNAESQT